MTFCTCIAGDSKGCYICKPNDFILYMGCWYRKDDKSMPRECGCGATKSSAPAPVCKEREYQVDEQLARLERNTQFLAEVVSILSRKLCRISRPETPFESTNKAVMQPQTPLAQEILGYNNNIETSIDNLRDITERVEIEDK